MLRPTFCYGRITVEKIRYIEERAGHPIKVILVEDVCRDFPDLRYCIQQKGNPIIGGMPIMQWWTTTKEEALALIKEYNLDLEGDFSYIKGHYPSEGYTISITFTEQDFIDIKLANLYYPDASILPHIIDLIDYKLKR